MTTERLEVPSPAAAEPELGLRQIADGLHALAQPLSGLRSAVELMNMSSTGDKGRYRQMCTTEIERACGMFSSLQKMVAIQTTEAKLTGFDLRQLLQSLLAEQGLSQRVLTAPFFATLCSEDAMVVGDVERTREAFSLLLSVLVKACENDGQIQASCQRTADFLVCGFKACDGSKQKPLDSADRLHVSLLRANLVSQAGRFEMQPDPFEIRMALPAAPKH